MGTIDSIGTIGSIGSSGVKLANVKLTNTCFDHTSLLIYS